MNRRSFIGLLAMAPVAAAAVNLFPEPNPVHHLSMGVDIGEGDYTVITLSGFAPSVSYKVGDRITLNGRDTYTITEVGDGRAYATDRDFRACY